MDNNSENVKSKYLSIFPVPEMRQLALAPQTSHFGHCTALAGTRNCFTQRTELEFCFRLSSNEEFAEDEMDGKLYRNKFPHLFIKLPGVSHRFRAHATRTAVFVIYPASALAAFEAAGVINATPCCEFELTPEIQQRIRELRSCEKRIHEPGISDTIDLAAQRLIAEVILQKAKGKNISEKTRLIMEIASFVECHIADKIDFRSIAEKKGLSLRSFFRLWKEQFKETPAQYLIARRLELAKRLLSRTDLCIDDISSQSGFSSTVYFIQTFKKHCGVTPGAYRKKSRA